MTLPCQDGDSISRDAPLKCEHIMVTLLSIVTIIGARHFVKITGKTHVQKYYFTTAT